MWDYMEDFLATCFQAFELTVEGVPLWVYFVGLIILAWCVNFIKTWTAGLTQGVVTDYLSSRRVTYDNPKAKHARRPVEYQPKHAKR